MERRNLSFASLILLALVGSLVTFFASNLFFADVVNFAVDLSGLFTTMPALMLGAMIVAAFLYVVRLYKRPKTLKRLSKLYLVIAIVLSAIGLICAILSGIVVYHSFVKPYPFAGYLILFMVIHIALIGGAVYGLLRVSKLPEDEETFKVTPKHVFKTIGWYLFVCLAFNRFGSFIVSPIFIHWRTFYMTFPFYLFLLVPIALGVVKMLVMYEFIPTKAALISEISISGAALILTVVIILIGVNETTFISAVSQCMPLERLAAKPVELPIHVASIAAVSAILIVQSVKALKK